MKNRSLDDLCFYRLYFCIFDAAKNLGLKQLSTTALDKVLPFDAENLSRYNIRVRNRDYISPEQIEMGLELDDILSSKNGRLLPHEDTFHNNLHYP